MPGSIRRYKLHSEIDENESKVQKSKYGLFAFFFFYFAGIGLLNTFLPIHWQKSGFTFAQIGAFNTSSAIAGGIALLPVSALSDRKRHRHLFVIVGAITSAICAILLKFVHYFQGIVVIQAFSGVAMSVGMSLAGAMCADAFQSRNAGKGFGSARAGGTFGYLLVMGLLLFVSLSVRNWLSFNLSSLCFLFAAASIALAPRPKNLAISPHADFRGLVGVLHNSSSIAFILCYFLMQMSFSGQMSYLALHMNNLKPAPEKGFIPLAFLVSSLVELPFMALSGKFIDRMGAMIPLKIACI